MVVYEAIVTGAEFLFGNVEGLGVAAALIVAAHYIHKGTLLALVFQNVRVVLIVVALLAISPVADVHPGVAIDFVMTGIDMLVGVLA